MLKKVNEAITRFNLLDGAKHVTIALSGGADSMALLYALLELKLELGLEKVSAAHFNHLIRGDEALRDQNFVAKQCKKLGVELTLGSGDVPKYAKENNLSLELAARKLRYEFFETLETDIIATAHTASDNVETVIFNITRGTALSGLCGIPTKRDKFIRPLILCSREEIEDYCEQKGVEFVTDSTNLSDEYTRNKIRHNVVPVLKTFNASVENAVSRMTASVREDEDFINGIANKKYEKLLCDNQLSLQNFDKLHTAIAKRIIAKYCNSLNIEVDNFHISAVYDICLLGGKTNLPQNKAAYVENGTLSIGAAKTDAQNCEFAVDIEKSDNDLFKNDKKVHNLLLKNTLDCDRIVGKLTLRTRETGDTIRLKNKNCTKTLKKLFCEYKIPLNERQNLPVLCDDEGVVWVYKIGVAERCAANENTNSIYKINVQKL